MMSNKMIKNLMEVLKPTIDVASLSSCPSCCGLEDDMKICGQHTDDCSMCWSKAVEEAIIDVMIGEKTPYDLKPAIKAIKAMLRSGCPSDCGLEDSDEICGISNVSCLVCWNKALNNHIDKKEENK